MNDTLLAELTRLAKGRQRGVKILGEQFIRENGVEIFDPADNRDACDLTRLQIAESEHALATKEVW